MQTLIKFKNFISEITAENSRNYKISILNKYKDDEDIRYYLDFVFNPYIITGISDKKLFKQFSLKSGLLVTGLKYNQLTDFKSLLEYLKVNNTGRDFDVLISTSYITAELDKSLWELACNVIIKNLRLGIDAKTINKVIPNLIPTFDVQLAEKYFERPEHVKEKEFAITTKIDGMRCIMMKENGKVSFWSRQGQPIGGLVDLEQEAIEKFPDNIVLDGELIANTSCLGNIYKETMKLARTKDDEKHGLKMMVFDYLPIEDFKNQKCDIPYNKRRVMLGKTFLHKIDGNDFISFVNKTFGLNKYIGNEHLYTIHIADFVNSGVYTYFNILPILYQGTDTNKIIELLNQQTAKGEEGVMINICDAPYEFKRTWNLLKVKKMQSLDLQVIGFEEGTNSNKGTLGALLVRYKDDNIVKVGSGFEKDLRDEIWNNREEWINAIIEVQFFEETENANGGKSIRFPVFKGKRFDKNIPDY